MKEYSILDDIRGNEHERIWQSLKSPSIEYPNKKRTFMTEAHLK